MSSQDGTQARPGLDTASREDSVNKVYIEPPYDRGYPWKLVYGINGESAVVSEESAVLLMARHDVPLGAEGEPGEIKKSPLGVDDRGQEIQLSKKARRILEEARR